MKRSSLLCCITLTFSFPAVLIAAEEARTYNIARQGPPQVDSAKIIIAPTGNPASSDDRNPPSADREGGGNAGESESPLKYMLPIIRELLPHVVVPNGKDSARNRQQVEVPDVRTMPLEQARLVLESKELAAEPVIQGPPGEPEDIVTSQSPLPRTYVIQGSSIRLEVTSPVMLKVPRVIGMALPEARNIIERTGLVLLAAGDKPSEGALVQDQDPPPDTGVRKGTVIRLTMGEQSIPAAAPPRPPGEPPDRLRPADQASPENIHPPSDSLPPSLQENLVPRELISSPRSVDRRVVFSPTALLVTALSIIALLCSAIIIRRSLRWYRAAGRSEPVDIVERPDPGEQHLQVSGEPLPHREVSVTLHQDKGAQELHID